MNYQAVAFQYGKIERVMRLIETVACNEKLSIVQAKADRLHNEINIESFLDSLLSDPKLESCCERLPFVEDVKTGFNKLLTSVYNLSHHADEEGQLCVNYLASLKNNKEDLLQSIKELVTTDTKLEAKKSTTHSTTVFNIDCQSLTM